MGMAVGGSSRRLEKNKEWGAAAVNCSQLWWRSPGCTGSSAGLGFTPWTQMLLPASSPAPVPFPGGGCSRAGPLVSLPMASWAAPYPGAARFQGGQDSSPPAPRGPMGHRGRPGLPDVGCARHPSPCSRRPLGMSWVAKSWAALRPFSALKWRQGNAEREVGEGWHMGSSLRHSGTGGRLHWRKAAEPTQGQAPGYVP